MNDYDMQDMVSDFLTGIGPIDWAKKGQGIELYGVVISGYDSEKGVYLNLGGWCYPLESKRSLKFFMEAYANATPEETT